VVGDGRVAQRVAGVGFAQVEVGVETDVDVRVAGAQAGHGDRVLAADYEGRGPFLAVIGEGSGEKVEILGGVATGFDVAVVVNGEVSEAQAGVLVVVGERRRDVANLAWPEAGAWPERRRRVQRCADDGVGCLAAVGGRTREHHTDRCDSVRLRDSGSSVADSAQIVTRSHL
jgi:hypothetical protein